MAKGNVSGSLGEACIAKMIVAGQVRLAWLRGTWQVRSGLNC
jgi:hypothetical protein